MRESDVEKYFVKQCEAQGWGVRKLKWIGRGDAPDRVVMMNYPRRTVWVELKAPGEKPRPSQAKEHGWMVSKGQDVHVIDTVEGVDQFVKDYSFR
jgi:hypothetical protein